MCSPRKSDENFSILHFYESKLILLTQDLKWSLEQSSALHLQRQTDLLLCTINCFLRWARPQNMAVGDLELYYSLYFCYKQPWTSKLVVPLAHHISDVLLKSGQNTSGVPAVSTPPMFWSIWNTYPFKH